MKTVNSRIITLGLMTVLIALPVRILLDHYSPDNGFLGMIYFGQKFQESALPEVKEISPVTSSPIGYDGQFYAQIALRPALDDALVPALDNASYRARRIGLPFLAFCLGTGKPARILQAYALLNFGFWLLLLAALSIYVGCRNFKDLLLAFALLWSTGTLACVERSLTDFPATVLGVLVVLSNCNWIVATLLLASTGLIKETSVLSFAAVPWRERTQGFDVKRIAISAFIIVLPIALWLTYVHIRLPLTAISAGTVFVFPFFGVVQEFCSAINKMATVQPVGSIPQQVGLLFQVICPLSLLIQATYLVARPRVSSKAWRFGIGFAVLLVFLGHAAWRSQYGYCRILMPLTFAFNLLIHKHESGGRFTAWYTAGNAGMCWLALKVLL